MLIWKGWGSHGGEEGTQADRVGRDPRGLECHAAGANVGGADDGGANCPACLIRFVEPRPRHDDLWNAVSVDLCPTCGGTQKQYQTPARQSTHFNLCHDSLLAPARVPASRKSCEQRSQEDGSCRYRETEASQSPTSAVPPPAATHECPAGLRACTSGLEPSRRRERLGDSGCCFQTWRAMRLAVLTVAGAAQVAALLIACRKAVPDSRFT